MLLELDPSFTAACFLNVEVLWFRNNLLHKNRVIESLGKSSIMINEILNMKLFPLFFGVIDFKVLCIFNAEIKGRKEFFNPINACDSQYVLKVHHLYNWNRYVSGLLVCLSMKTRSPLDVLVWCHLPSWAIWSPPTLRPQFRPARLSRLRTRDNLQKVSIRISTSISNLNLEFVIKLLSQHV